MYMRQQAHVVLLVVILLFVALCYALQPLLYHVIVQRVRANKYTKDKDAFPHKHHPPKPAHTKPEPARNLRDKRKRALFLHGGVQHELETANQTVKVGHNTAEPVQNHHNKKAGCIAIPKHSDHQDETTDIYLQIPALPKLEPYEKGAGLFQERADLNNRRLTIYR